jgi:hypothetical protein
MRNLDEIVSENESLVVGLTDDELKRSLRIAHADANRISESASDDARRIVAILGFERLAVELQLRKEHGI